LKEEKEEKEKEEKEEKEKEKEEKLKSAEAAAGSAKPVTTISKPPQEVNDPLNDFSADYGKSKNSFELVNVGEALNKSLTL